MEFQENSYERVEKTNYMWAGVAGQHVVGFGDVSIDLFLEVPNEGYCQILYLTYYIAYELHRWYTI